MLFALWGVFPWLEIGIFLPDWLWTSSCHHTIVFLVIMVALKWHTGSVSSLASLLACDGKLKHFGGAMQHWRIWISQQLCFMLLASFSMFSMPLCGKLLSKFFSCLALYSPECQGLSLLLWVSTLPWEYPWALMSPCEFQSPINILTIMFIMLPS